MRRLLVTAPGLAFSPAALAGPPGKLDADDPAVVALVAQIGRQKPSVDALAMADLNGLRMLARGDDEVSFGYGLPPDLLTVAMRREGRRDRWASAAVSKAHPLRVTRGGVRASNWCLDPAGAPDPTDTVVRVLVTAQTWAAESGPTHVCRAPIFT